MTRTLLFASVILIILVFGAALKIYIEGNRKLGGPTEELVKQSSLTSESSYRLTTDIVDPVVEFDGASFNPSVIRIAKGLTVHFKNKVEQPVWVASDPHPLHSAYSRFDALRGYARHEIFSFTFDQPGTWQYHNHLEPGQIGTIIVE